MEPKRHFIRDWRKHRGLTLERAGEAIGMDGSNLGKIERGEVPYKQETLEDLALLYDCEVAELLSQDPNEEGRIIRLAARARPDQRRAIAAVAESILGFRHDEEAPPAARRR